VKLRNKLSKIILFFFLFLISISCDSGLTDSGLGVISVIVVDNDANKTPVPNVLITIMPNNIIRTTDLNGITTFEVEPGNYFVDAEVCCLGPGNIIYHEPVTVIENKTSEVKLEACLSCD
jgi:hypothetical protein